MLHIPHLYGIVFAQSLPDKALHICHTYNNGYVLVNGEQVFYYALILKPFRGVDSLLV